MELVVSDEVSSPVHVHVGIVASLVQLKYTVVLIHTSKTVPVLFVALLNQSINSGAGTLALSVRFSVLMLSWLSFHAHTVMLDHCPQSVGVVSFQNVSVVPLCHPLLIETL